MISQYQPCTDIRWYSDCPIFSIRHVKHVDEQTRFSFTSCYIVCYWNHWNLIHLHAVMICHVGVIWFGCISWSSHGDVERCQYELMFSNAYYISLHFQIYMDNLVLLSYGNFRSMLRTMLHQTRFWGCVIVCVWFCVCDFRSFLLRMSSIVHAWPFMSAQLKY